MSSVSRRLAGSAVAIASAMTVLTASYAHAVYDLHQYTYCDFGQRGMASWREPSDTDWIAVVKGLWRDPNNHLVEGPRTNFTWDGPSVATIHGQGDDHWALYGILFEVDGEHDLQEYGTPSCSGGAEIAFTTIQNLPVRSQADLRGTIGAPPALGISTGPITIT